MVRPRPARSWTAVRAGAWLGISMAAVGMQMGAGAGPGVGLGGLPPRTVLRPAPSARENPLADVPVPERDAVKIDEKRGGKVPLDLVFRDERGAIVPLSRWFGEEGGGRPVVVILMYFRCPLMCPQTISSLMKAVNGAGLKIGEDYNVVVVSFDPTEGPSDAAVQREGILAQYQGEVTKATERGLAVLTETAGNARTLANALGFGYKFMPGANQYSHMNVGFVLTQDGTISQYLKGVNYGGDTLKYALVEAGEGRVGDLIDRAALWCLAIDPVSGRYQLNAKRMMQAGGVLSSVLVLGVVAFSVRADRRRRRAALARGAGAPGESTTVLSGGATRPSDPGLST